jgi:hypothetical protein
MSPYARLHLQLAVHPRQPLSAFLGPGNAPALTGNFLAAEQRAAARCGTGGTLIQGAVVAKLAGGILGLFAFIHFAGVVLVTERGRLCIGVGDHGLRVGLCDCTQRQAAACYLLQKDATRIFGACGLAGHVVFLSDSPDHPGGHC